MENNLFPSFFCTKQVSAVPALGNITLQTPLNTYQASLLVSNGFCFPFIYVDNKFGMMGEIDLPTTTL